MKEKIKQIMQDVFGLKEVSDDIARSNCENWDSLRHFNLIVELEMVFNISLEPDEIEKMKSLDDITTIISQKNTE